MMPLEDSSIPSKDVSPQESVPDSQRVLGRDMNTRAICTVSQLKCLREAKAHFKILELLERALIANIDEIDDVDVLAFIVRLPDCGYAAGFAAFSRLKGVDVAKITDLKTLEATATFYHDAGVRMLALDKCYNSSDHNAIFELSPYDDVRLELIKRESSESFFCRSLDCFCPKPGQFPHNVEHGAVYAALIARIKELFDTFKEDDFLFVAIAKVSDDDDLCEKAVNRISDKITLDHIAIVECKISAGLAVVERLKREGGKNDRLADILARTYSENVALAIVDAIPAREISGFACEVKMCKFPSAREAAIRKCAGDEGSLLMLFGRDRNDSSRSLILVGDDNPAGREFVIEEFIRMVDTLTDVRSLSIVAICCTNNLAAARKAVNRINVMAGCSNAIERITETARCPEIAAYARSLRGGVMPFASMHNLAA